MSGSGEHRTVGVGQWLGTENRIVSMKWTGLHGWLASDSTGESYCQRRPPARSLIVHCPDGLLTFESPEQVKRGYERTPWPSTPSDSGRSGDE